MGALCECGCGDGISGSVALHKVKESRFYPVPGDKHYYDSVLVAAQGKANFDLASFVSGPDMAQYWHKIVSEYTRLRITRGTDMLPALSGCAQNVAMATGSEYLAGMWRHSLGRDLVWYVEAPLSSTPQTEWRAPSWSWASIDAKEGVLFSEIRQSSRLKDVLDSIAGIDCRPEGIDPMGKVRKGACLRLRTQLYQVPLRRLCDNCRWSAKDRRKRSAHFAIGTHDRGKLWEDTKNSFRSSRQPLSSTELCSFEDRGPSLGDTIRITLLPDFALDRLTTTWALAKRGRCKQTAVLLFHVCDSRVPRRAEGVDYFLALHKVSEPAPQATTTTSSGTGSSSPTSLFGQTSQQPAMKTFERFGLVKVMGTDDDRKRWIAETLSKRELHLQKDEDILFI